MRKFFIIVTIFLFSFLSGETFTREELLDMGCYRIGDVLLHVKAASFTSVDGFHYNTNIIRYNKQSVNYYKVFIDDHLFKTNVMEGAQLNWLPIDMNSIDSIVIIDKNCLYKGEFLQDGAIQIYTKKNKQVVSVNAGGNWGNESGDPGPLKYTELETENVDKIGQNMNGYLSVNIDENYISGFVNYRQHTYRDPRIVDRIKLSMQDKYWIGMDQFSAGEMVNLKNHSLFVSQVYGKNCFYYHPVFNIEVPADIYYDHASYAGDFNLFGIGIDLRSMWENYKSEYIENSYERDLNWNISSIKNNIKIIKQLNSNIIVGGFDYDIINFDNHNYKYFTGFLGFLHTNSKLHNQFDIAINRLDDGFNSEFGFKAAFTSALKFEEKNQLNSNFYIQSFSSAEISDVKYFLAENAQNFIDYNYINEKKSKGLNLGFNISAEIKEWNMLFIKIGIPVNYYLNVIESKSFPNDTLDHTMEFLNRLSDNYFSSNYGINFETKIFLNNQISTSIFYQYLKYLYDDHFDLLDNNFYSSKVTASIKYKPAKSFSTFINFNYWKNNFKQIHYINHKKHEITTIDVSLIKYFWHNRFSANLMLKNLLNSRYWLHSEGIAFDRSMYFGVNCWL